MSFRLPEGNNPNLYHNQKSCFYIFGVFFKILPIHQPMEKPQTAFQVSARKKKFQYIHILPLLYWFKKHTRLPGWK